MKSFYMKQPYADEQVRAIIEGRKTLLIEPLSDKEILDLKVAIALGEISDFIGEGDVGINDEPYFLDYCKYKVGEHYWLKEAFKFADWTNDGDPWIEFKTDGESKVFRSIPSNWRGRVESIYEELSASYNFDIDQCAADRKWRPSIHMPQWASRFKMEVTRAYIKRIKDISDDERIKVWDTCWSNDTEWCWLVEFKGVTNIN